VLNRHAIYYCARLNLPFEERQYCQTFAIYMEGLLPFTMKKIHERQTFKMEKKTKKSSGIPFTLEKLWKTADVIKR
jgi:hypothetical protein